MREICSAGSARGDEHKRPSRKTRPYPLRDRGVGDEARIRHRRVLYTDATHLKANAHENKFELQRVKPFEYLGKLGQTIREDRAAQGKGEVKPGRARLRGRKSR